MPALSQRSEQLGTENAFVVLNEVARLQAAGRDIVSFCIGQPDFPTPVHIQDAAVAAIRSGKHGYTPSAGIAELRAAIARDVSRLRGIEVVPDDVVVGAGAKPFIAYAILTTTDHGAGDEVVYPNPGFPIYDSQIRAMGAVGVPVALREARGYSLDPTELESKITSRTKLVILNSPHNPTGGIIGRADMEAIAAVLRRHPHVWVFADEIYSRLVHEGEFVSIASLPGMAERTIICDGMSKTWAMTGWRLGYAVNRALAPVLTRWVTNTDSCASQSSQWGAGAARDGPPDAAEAMRASFHARRDRIVRGLNAIPGVACASPGGAFYAWPNITEACSLVGAKDSEEFRSRLLHEAGVAVLSDIHFGPRVPGDGQHLRFSYAASEAMIDEGLARLARFVAGGS
jgi:aspartate/methionine/tyrosine aminotransferase